jgi:hypothetical protein
MREQKEARDRQATALPGYLWHLHELRSTVER